jgi:hypothetical protein
MPNIDFLARIRWEDLTISAAELIFILLNLLSPTYVRDN